MHKLCLRAAVIAACATAGTGPAAIAADGSGGDDGCTGRSTQSHGPLIVRHVSCVQAGADGWVGMDPSSTVVAGHDAVVACVLYVRMWRNHRLVVNTRSRTMTNCREDRFGDPRIIPRRYPAGTRVTVQSYLDVRYQTHGGRLETWRFPSPTDTHIVRRV